MKCYGLFVSLSLGLLAPARLIALPFALRPGHLYTHYDHGIREYDADLNLIASQPVPNTNFISGVAFTQFQNLTFSATNGNIDHVKEMDGSGAIVHDIIPTNGGPNRGGHTAVDASGRIYAAGGGRLIEVQPDFSSFRTFSGFLRTSGMAIGPDDRLFVTDQSANTLTVFDVSRNVQHVFSTNLGPAGIDFSPAGELYLCDFFHDTLLKVNPDTGASTVVLSGLDSISDIEFAPDGSYYVSYNRGNDIEHRSPTNALLSSLSTTDVSDSLAFMIPEPCFGLTPFVMLAWQFLRRPKKS